MSKINIICALFFFFIFGGNRASCGGEESESQNQTRHYPYFFSSEFMKLNPKMYIQQTDFKSLDDKTKELFLEYLNTAHLVLSDVRYDLCDIEKYSKKHPELKMHFMNKVQMTFRKIHSLEESFDEIMNAQAAENEASAVDALELFKWAIQDPDKKIFSDVRNYLDEKSRLENKGTYANVEFLDIFTETSVDSTYFKETSSECPGIQDL